MKYIFTALVAFLIPLSAFAASIDLSDVAPTHVHDQFAVTVSLTTDTASINAVEGSLVVPASLHIESIQLTGSLVPLWVSAPNVTSPGTITFAGVLPGGFQGSGNLFTLILTAEKAGSESVAFGADTHAYQNDGAGTAVLLKKGVLKLSVGSASASPSIVSTTDTTPPEPFTPALADGAAFSVGGKVLVFATQDKDSGIDHYDSASSYNGHASEKSLDWHVVTSPYTLSAGDSTHYIYVRAVDHAGNTRVQSLPPQTFSPIAFIYTWWLALLGFLALLVILTRSWFRR